MICAENYKLLVYSNKTWSQLTSYLQETIVQSRDALCARLILSEPLRFLGVLLAYILKIIQRGDPWKILKKQKKLNFFPPHKILYNTHMRSHKKFQAKKMIFRGAFGGGLSERKKIKSGVWCVHYLLTCCFSLLSSNKQYSLDLENVNCTVWWNFWRALVFIIDFY